VLLVGERLECRDWETGALRWSSPMAERPTWVGGQEDSIVLATGSQIAVLDSRSGETRWSREVQSGEPGGAIRRLKCEAGMLLVLDSFRGVEAVDLRSGVILWRFPPVAGSDLEWGWAAGDRRSRIPRMTPFWWSHEGVLAVQSESPRKVVFLEVADGFARESSVSTGARWREDPRSEPGLGWGVVCQRDLVQRLDPRTGTVVTMDLASQIIPNVSAGEQRRSAPVLWSDGTGALVQPTGHELEWIPWGGGGRGWKVTLRHRVEGWTPPVCRDEHCLYFMDGTELCAVDSVQGGLLWRRLLDVSHPGDSRRIQRLDDHLLVVWENDAGEVRFELRDPTNGDLDWVLQPVGKQRDWRIVDGAGGVVVLTDSQVSVSDLVSVRR
jgi:hypothetical protein